MKQDWQNSSKTREFQYLKKSILKLIRTKQLRRLRDGLSRLREHKFKHSFQDTLNAICNCGEDIETSSHYLLHTPDYLEKRMGLLYDKEILDNMNNINILYIYIYI